MNDLVKKWLQVLVISNPVRKITNYILYLGKVYNQHHFEISFFLLKGYVPAAAPDFPQGARTLKEIRPNFPETARKKKKIGPRECIKNVSV